MFMFKKQWFQFKDVTNLLKDKNNFKYKLTY